MEERRGNEERVSWLDAVRSGRLLIGEGYETAPSVESGSRSSDRGSTDPGSWTWIGSVNVSSPPALPLDT
jgi:hypothetical protein